MRNWSTKIPASYKATWDPSLAAQEFATLAPQDTGITHDPKMQIHYCLGTRHARQRPPQSAKRMTPANRTRPHCTRTSLQPQGVPTTPKCEFTFAWAHNEHANYLYGKRGQMPPGASKPSKTKLPGPGSTSIVQRDFHVKERLGAIRSGGSPELRHQQQSE